MYALERDYPEDYMSNCFIDIADRIHQCSPLELNVRESLRNRKYYNFRGDIRIILLTMDTVISVTLYFSFILRVIFRFTAA